MIQQYNAVQIKTIVTVKMNNVYIHIKYHKNISVKIRGMAIYE